MKKDMKHATVFVYGGEIGFMTEKYGQKNRKYVYTVYILGHSRLNLKPNIETLHTGSFPIES